MRGSACWTKAISDQPAIKWEEEALEVLNNRAQVGLDLDLRPTPILSARPTMELLRLGEQPLALPHPLGNLFAELRLVHLSLDFVEEILVHRAQHEARTRIGECQNRLPNM
jgi:hypothetical protein